jgi:hypothetical protein
MRTFLLCALLCNAHTAFAFQLTQTHTLRRGLSPLASTPESDTPKTETSTSVETFASETPAPAAPAPASPAATPMPPVVALDEQEGLAIDYDALSNESAEQAFRPKTDISDMYVKNREERRAPRQAKWFPMLLSPSALDGSYAGDVGFDPLGFSSDKPTFLRMREAELKHCRLAMLAAAGWPLSELWHKEIAELLGLDSILADADRAPSVLNGGLTNAWVIGTGVAALAVGALLEFRTFSQAEKADYRAGDLGFDPLGLHNFRASFGLDPITEVHTNVLYYTIL